MTGPWYTTAFGAHYPLLYGHRDEEEARRCLELLPQLEPLGKITPILDLGCGDGRHLRQLADQGHPVVGMDLSPHLLARAAERFAPEKGLLVRGDMRDLPFAGNSLGAVMSLFTAFGYFGTLAENGPVVREIQRVLAPGGHWYLDYVDCDRVRRELSAGSPPTRRRELGPLSVAETRRLAEGQQRVEKRVILTPLPGAEEAAATLGVGPDGIIYTESVALFDRVEIEELALQQGLSLIATAGSYEGLPLGQGTRWIMVFRNEGSSPAGQADNGVK